MEENQCASGECANTPSIGPIIGSVIIIIILVLGGFYFWGQKASNIEQMTPTTETIVRQAQIQGTSDETTDIEKDLNETNIGDIDSNTKDLEKEIGL